MNEKTGTRGRGTAKTRRLKEKTRLTSALLILLLIFAALSTACRPVIELVKSAIPDPAQTEAPQSGGAQPSGTPSAVPVHQKSGVLTVYWALAIDFPQLAEGVRAGVERELHKTRPNLTIDYYDPIRGDLTMDKQTVLDKMYADMMVGKGPDLIVSSGGQDIYKQMRSGVFLALDSRLAEDDMLATGPGTRLVDACSYNGKMYIMPISYDLVAAMVAKDTLALTGIDPKACATAEGYIGELEKYIAGGGTRNFSGSPYDYNELYSLLASIYPGPELLRQEMDTPLFLSIVELAGAEYEARKGLYDKSELEYETFEDGTQYISNSAALAIRSIEQGKAVYWDSFGINFNEFPLYSLFAEIRGGIAHIPVQNIAGGATALLNDYAAVRRSTKMQDEAWDYIRAFVKILPTDYNIRSFPVFTGENLFNPRLSWKELIETHLRVSDYWDELFPPTMSKGEKDALRNKPNDMEQFAKDYAAKVNTALISTYAHDIVAECFTDYFEGKATYEGCLETAKLRLDVYLTE